MRSAVRAYLLVLLVAVCGASASDEGIPIPEYFGTYAVGGGKLLGIDVPQSTMTPHNSSVRLGQRAAVGAVLDGQPTASSQPVQVPELPPTVQFLIFMQAGGAITPMMVGQSLYLRGLVFVRNMSVDTGWPSNVRRTGPENAWDSGDPGELLGLGQSDITKRVVLLTKPVSGHNDMVLVVPASQLSPGVYALGTGEPGTPFAQRPFLFAVAPASEGESQKCADVACTYAMMASKCQASLCAGNRPVSTGSPVPGTGQAQSQGLLADLSKSEPYSSNFQIQVREFSASFDQVWEAVQRALQKQKDKIATSDSTRGLIVTELTLHGFWDSRRVKYYIQLEILGPSSSRLSVKLLRYDRDVHQGGPLDVILVPEPNERETLKQVAAFFEEVQKQLASLASGGKPTDATTMALTVNEHTLSATETKWVQHIASNVVPTLAGDRSQRIHAASLVTWWSLKEGILDKGNPIAFSSCGSENSLLGPLETCDSGQAWQVGMAGVQVTKYRTLPDLEATTRKLFRDRTVDQVLGDVATQAGYDANSQIAQAIQTAKGDLRRSWLLRASAVGFTYEADTVRGECVEQSKTWCYGTGWEATKLYAPDRDAAQHAIADLAAIIDRLSPH